MGDGTEGPGNTLMNGQVGHSLVHRGAVGPDDASMAPQLGAEPPDLRRRHGCFAPQPVARLGRTHRGPVALRRRQDLLGTRPYSTSTVRHGHRRVDKARANLSRRGGLIIARAAVGRKPRSTTGCHITNEVQRHAHSVCLLRRTSARSAAAARCALRRLARRCRLRPLVRRPCQSAWGLEGAWSRNPAEHTLGADVFIDVRPVDPVTVTNQLPMRPLGRRRVRETPRPRQWHTDHSAVGKMSRNRLVGDLNPPNRRFRQSSDARHGEIRPDSLIVAAWCQVRPRPVERFRAATYSARSAMTGSTRVARRAGT